MKINKITLAKSMLLLSFLSTSLSANFFSADHGTWKFNNSEYSDKGAPLDNNVIDVELAPKHNKIMKTMNQYFPEFSSPRLTHSNMFFAVEDKPEIILNEDSEVFITFHSSRSFLNNSVGYYVSGGMTGQAEARNINDLIDYGKIVFPNTTSTIRGGDLKEGTTISIGEFLKGTKISLFLVSSGWQGGQDLANQDYLIASTKAKINIDSLIECMPIDVRLTHSVSSWMNDDDRKDLLIGFEDLLSTMNPFFHDYNDVFISVSARQKEDLIDTIELETGVPGIPPAKFVPLPPDADSDTVPDYLDEFPYDPDKCQTTYTPSERGHSTLVFEDMYPSAGDYDLNDLSIIFAVEEDENALGLVKEIRFYGYVNSYGATYTDGFRIQLKTPAANVLAVMYRETPNDTYELALDAIIPDGDNVVIKLFDDASQFLQKGTHRTLIDDDVIAENSFQYKIILKVPANLTPPPYNSFLNVSRNILVDAENNTYELFENIEVHLPGAKPTSLNDSSLVGTKDESKENSYLTNDGRPWGLMIPQKLFPVTEGFHISTGYKFYSDWVNSKGKSHKDWYDSSVDSNINSEFLSIE